MIASRSQVWSVQMKGCKEFVLAGVGCRRSTMQNRAASPHIEHHQPAEGARSYHDSLSMHADNLAIDAYVMLETVRRVLTGSECAV